METVPGGHGGVAWREQRRTVRASVIMECVAHRRTGKRSREQVDFAQTEWRKASKSHRDMTSKGSLKEEEDDVELSGGCHGGGSLNTYEAEDTQLFYFAQHKSI